MVAGLKVVCAVLALVWGMSGAAIADKKVALVIGNSNYQHTSPLANPLNDEADIAAALRKLDFTVIEGTDLDKLAMDRTIRRFAKELVGADLGTLFYAGHGLQVDGQNFLVPIDAKLDDATSLEFETIRLDAIHRTMERATRTNLVFLDACRDNPLARNLARSLGTRSTTVGRGLAVIESGEGTLISFSTQPGNVAQDGKGRNSPYAAALTKQLLGGREDVLSMLTGVRNDVIRETNRRQVPWEHTALTAKVYLASAEPEKPPQSSPGAALPTSPSYAQQAELSFWAAVKDSRDPGVLQTYIDAYPQGTFVALVKVLIGKINAETAREQELRTAELARRDAESRKQTDDVKRFQDEAKKAQAALAVAEKERQAALNAAEAARKAQEDARKQPEAVKEGTQVANLAYPPPPLVTVEAGVSSEAIARSIQQELRRVGCDVGAIDGNWGAKTRDALAEFAQLTKEKLSTDKPTTSALEALKVRKERVCPLRCEEGEILRNGNCVVLENAPTRKKPIAINERSPSKTRDSTRPETPQQSDTAKLQCALEAKALTFGKCLP